MTYTVVFSKSARRAIAALPQTVAWAVLAFCGGPLAENPQRVGKPLIGPLQGLHSARRGEYRVIYSIDDDRIVVAVVSIRHRADAYRR